MGEVSCVNWSRERSLQLLLNCILILFHDNAPRLNPRPAKDRACRSSAADDSVGDRRTIAAWSARHGAGENRVPRKLWLPYLAIVNQHTAATRSSFLHGLLSIA